MISADTWGANLLEVSFMGCPIRHSQLRLFAFYWDVLFGWIYHLKKITSLQGISCFLFNLDFVFIWEAHHWCHRIQALLYFMHAHIYCYHYILICTLARVSECLCTCTAAPSISHELLTNCSTAWKVLGGPLSLILRTWTSVRHAFSDSGNLILGLQLTHTWLHEWARLHSLNVYSITGGTCAIGKLALTYALPPMVAKWNTLFFAWVISIFASGCRLWFFFFVRIGFSPSQDSNLIFLFPWKPERYILLNYRLGAFGNCVLC